MARVKIPSVSLSKKAPSQSSNPPSKSPTKSYSSSSTSDSEAEIAKHYDTTPEQSPKAKTQKTSTTTPSRRSQRIISGVVGQKIASTEKEQEPLTVSESEESETTLSAPLGAEQEAHVSQQTPEKPKKKAEGSSSKSESLPSRWEKKGIVAGRIYLLDEMCTAGWDFYPYLDKQGWSHLLKDEEPVYKNLVKAFFANAKVNQKENSISSKVKKVSISLTMDTLSEALKIPNKGRKLCGKNWYTEAGTTKSKVLSELLKEPRLEPTATNLLDPVRIMHSMCIHSLVTRAGSSERISDTDLSVIYHLYKRKSLNLNYIIIQHLIMTLTATRSTASLPYGMIFTKLFKYFKVPLSDETGSTEHNVFRAKNIRLMGIKFFPEKKETTPKRKSKRTASKDPAPAISSVAEEPQPAKESHPSEKIPQKLKKKSPQKQERIKTTAPSTDLRKAKGKQVVQEAPPTSPQSQSKRKRSDEEEEARKKRKFERREKRRLEAEELQRQKQAEELALKTVMDCLFEAAHHESPASEEKEPSQGELPASPAKSPPIPSDLPPEAAPSQGEPTPTSKRTSASPTPVIEDIIAVAKEIAAEVEAAIVEETPRSPTVQPASQAEPPQTDIPPAEIPAPTTDVPLGSPTRTGNTFASANVAQFLQTPVFDKSALKDLGQSGPTQFESLDSSLFKDLEAAPSSSARTDAPPPPQGTSDNTADRLLLLERQVKDIKANQKKIKHQQKQILSGISIIQQEQRLESERSYVYQKWIMQYAMPQLAPNLFPPTIEQPKLVKEIPAPTTSSHSSDDSSPSK